MEGKGTHAAMPHMGSDPILATACLIQFYQTLITKFRDPLIPAVFSITSIHGGTGNNVIPDRVECWEPSGRMTTLYGIRYSN